MIDQFSGEYFFLSNFSSSDVWLDLTCYKTVEHAYQAAKTFDIRERMQILQASTPGEAKKLGRKVGLRTDWEQTKDGIMKSLVRQKFKMHPHLYDLLLATIPHRLVEGNWWGDTYWGVCNGVGENKLGAILMDVRAELARHEYA